MGFRITTNMMMNTYKFNLQNNTQKLANARDMVLTQRNFNSYEEDPAAATRAFRLRRTYTRTLNQLNNTTDCYSKYNTAWNNLGGVIDKLANPLDKTSAILGANGTAGESRKALAQILRDSADSLVHSMNQQLGDQFIFGGKDGLNVPFTWSEDGRTLLYRGVNVDAGGVEKPASTPPAWLDDAKAAGQAAGTWDDNDEAWFSYYAGTSEKIPNSDTMPKWAKDMLKQTPNNADESAWMEYYRDRDDVAKLKTMSEEEMYIDLGMGAKENAPNDPILGSYFNGALSGLNFIGYGTDKTDEFGDSGNYAILLKELADVFETWDEDVQDYNPELAKEGSSAFGLTKDELKEKAFRMLDKLKAGQEKITENWVDLDAQSKFLLTNKERLETQKTNINEEILEVEQVDLAEAITQFSWEQYCYNAALKIGNQLLTQSLIDYMN